MNPTQTCKASASQTFPAVGGIVIVTLATIGFCGFVSITDGRPST